MAKSCCQGEEVLMKVAHIAAPYAGREDMLIEVLQQAQKVAHNAATEDVVSVIAQVMGIPKSKVYSVVSFYAFFSSKVRGKHIIRMCHSAPCHVKGAKELLEAFKKELGVEIGETTADGKFTLEMCECLGNCDKSPCVLIDDEVYGPLAPSDICELLKKFD